MPPKRAGSHSVGFDYTTVTVETITEDGRTAHCLDSHGQPRTVNAEVMRGKGGKPKPGERWIVNREFGNWTFVACLTPDLPVVTGSRSGVPALVLSLLDALVEQGIVQDGTT